MGLSGLQRQRHCVLDRRRHGRARAMTGRRPRFSFPSASSSSYLSPSLSLSLLPSLLPSLPSSLHFFRLIGLFSDSLPLYSSAVLYLTACIRVTPNFCVTSRLHAPLFLRVENQLRPFSSLCY